MAMCSLAVESSEWLMVDGWESAQAEYQRTVLVLDYFQSALNTHWKGKAIVSNSAHPYL